MKPLTILATLALTGTSLFAQGEEGGYVYNQGEARFVDNVFNFLDHFNYDQYVWCEDWLFTTSNNSNVDNMDFEHNPEQLGDIITKVDAELNGLF